MKQFKFFGKKDRNNMENGSDMDEDIDMNMLFSILDHIGSEQSISLPSDEILSLVKQDRSPELLSLISKMYMEVDWQNMDDDLTNRWVLCIECKTQQCEHTDSTNHKNIIDEASSICNHETDEFDLFNTCVQCLLDISKEYKDEDSPLALLWDTRDTAQFYSWMIDINLDYGLYN